MSIQDLFFWFMMICLAILITGGVIYIKVVMETWNND